MWIRVATDKDSVHIKTPISYSYIEGPGTEEFYFDKIIAEELAQDGFLTEMWDKFDSPLDWGDCEFFPPDKCKMLKE